jgi:hypothetical protein
VPIGTTGRAKLPAPITLWDRAGARLIQLNQHAESIRGRPGAVGTPVKAAGGEDDELED